MTKMVCRACGAEMNFHAEKMIWAEAGQDAQRVSVGQMQEIHTCPHCGRTDTRPSPEDATAF